MAAVTKIAKLIKSSFPPERLGIFGRILYEISVGP